MNRYFITTLFLICIKVTFGQYLNMDIGLNNQVRSLYYDSTSNYLYAGGHFTHTGSVLNPQQYMGQISRWNGVFWDTLGLGVEPGQHINDIIFYNGDIIVGGTFRNAGGIPTIGLARWDGQFWHAFANATYVGYGGVNTLYEDGQNLYVGGVFDSINGIPAYGVARFDGTTWYTYPSLGTLSVVGAIIVFNNELYVGGNFDVGIGKSDIVKYDGSGWVTVGGGFVGNSAWVQDFEIYQNKLFVAGFFSMSAGDPGNNIAIWDGNIWSPAGIGTFPSPSNIFIMHEFQNELYIGGEFQSAGGYSVSKIAKWDGNTWFTLPGNPQISNSITSMTSNSNFLFVGGGFQTINNDTVNNIFQYSSLTGISELNFENHLVYPNPSDGIITVKTGNTSSQFNLELFDLIGKEVKSFKVINGDEVSMEDLPNGCYIYTLFDADGYFGHGKIIKE